MEEGKRKWLSAPEARSIGALAAVNSYGWAFWGQSLTNPTTFRLIGGLNGYSRVYVYVLAAAKLTWLTHAELLASKLDLYFKPAQNPPA